MNYQPMTTSEILDALDRLTWICFAFAVAALATTLVIEGDALMMVGGMLSVLGAVFNAAGDYLDKQASLDSSVYRARRFTSGRYPTI